jgi:hypothetical protein
VFWPTREFEFAGLWILGHTWRGIKLLKFIVFSSYRGAGGQNRHWRLG